MSCSDLDEMIFLHLSVKWFGSIAPAKSGFSVQKFSFNKSQKLPQIRTCLHGTSDI